MASNRNVSRISIAAPEDFVCADASVVDALPPAFPYCLDFLRRRCLYVGDLDASGVVSSAFYYLHLRRHAGRIFSVPIERLRFANGPTDVPVFVFSPGRCGSTLLSRVLAEAGIPSAAEPDFYTQMASWFWSHRLNPFAPVFRQAMWAMSDDLCRALGAAPVVKLRAECARTPELLVRDPGQRTIVMVRRFETWSRSTALVFGASPAKAVRKYMTALRCYAWLRRNSRCQLVRFEDWLSDPRGAADALGGFLGRSVGVEAVQRASRSHSQQGTPLLGRTRPGWEAKWQGALRLWQSPRLVTARQRLEIPNVWD